MSTYTTVATFTTSSGLQPPLLQVTGGVVKVVSSYLGFDVLPGFTSGDYLTITNAPTVTGPPATSLNLTRLQFTGSDTLYGYPALTATAPEGFPNTNVYGDLPSWPDGVVFTVERLSSGGGGGGDTGYSLPEYGVPTFVDRAWGNLPMQPNTQRAADGEGTIVVVEPNAPQNTGWSGFSVFRSEQLDPALGDHVIAVTGYNGFPEFGTAGATGATGSTAPTGLVIPFTSEGQSTLEGLTFSDSYGNPSPSFRVSAYSNDGDSSTARLRITFTLPAAQVAAFPELVALRNAATALSNSTFNMDWYSGVPVHVQYDAWVRSTAGANLRHFELDTLLGYSGPGGWPVFNQLDGNNQNGMYFNRSASAIRATLDTASAGVYFANDPGTFGTTRPISAPEVFGGAVSFTIFLTIDTSAEFGLVEDSYGNPVTDSYGTPVVIDGYNAEMLNVNGTALTNLEGRPNAGTLTIKA